MQAGLFILAPVTAAGAATNAHALTSDEVKARLEAAGYSQIREMPPSKIEIFKAVKDGASDRVSWTATAT